MARWPFLPNMIGQKRADSTTIKIVDELKLTNGVIMTDEPPPLGDKSGATRMVASHVVANTPLSFQLKLMKMSL